jgi:hypothetical protein
MIDVTEKRGRRHKQLLDKLSEEKEYCKLKKEVPDRALWRTRFGKCYGPVVRQTTELMNLSDFTTESEIQRR